MPFNPHLTSGQVIDNTRLCEIFKCSPQGGMRKSNSTNSLVIVSNHVASIYDDRWDNDVLHYTGMGQAGDQSLSFMQNRTLAESPTNGVQVFLVEVHRSHQYTYRGEVELAAEPYQETQPDEQGVLRQVWMFPIRLKSQQVPPALSLVEETYEQKLKQARRLTDDELLRRAQNGRINPGKRQLIATQYERSPWVAEYVKRRARGRCEGCGGDAPFVLADGTPFLEVHHIKPMAEGGSDVISNTVALCPNCHRRCHHSTDKLAYAEMLSKKLV